MSAVRLVLALWGGLFLALGPLRSPGDGDLYWQRWLGDIILQTHQLPTSLGAETFTSAGIPWVPQEWFFSVLVALFAHSGLFLVFALLVSSIPIGILVSIYLQLRGRVKPEAIAIVVFFCGAALVESFGIRAQVLGWGCFAAFMFFLRSPRLAYVAVPIVILWANVHASVMIAPAIVLARVAGALFDGGLRNLLRSRDLRILPLTILAIFATPLGTRLPVYAWSLAGSPIRAFITEWQPPGLGDASFLFGAVPLALLAILPGVKIFTRNRVESFPVAMLFLAMLFASRNVPLFAIAAAPLAAFGVEGSRNVLRSIGDRARSMERAAMVAVFVAVALSALLLAWKQRYEPPRLPIAAMSSLAAERSGHRLFCEDFTWCSIALQFPRLRVFMDGRCDPYRLNVWDEYIAAIRVDRSWSAPLQRFHVDAILALRGSRFSNALATNALWRRSFEDQSFVVYERKSAQLVHG